MAAAHEIRLAGPWEFTRADANDSPQRCTLPFSPPDGTNQPGPVTLTRRFHRPTGLDENSQVWIAVEFTGTVPTLAVNDIPLDAGDSDVSNSKAQQATFNATDVLRDFNMLMIEFRGHQISNVLLRIFS